MYPPLVLIETTMQPGNGEAVSRTISRHRVDLFVGTHDGVFSLHFAAATPQVADELVESFELFSGGFIPIEIAYQTDAQRDVIKVIAVNVAAIDLSCPTVANFNLSIA